MEKKTKKIVYLYSEVLPYAISVMRAIVKNMDVTVECVHWDVKTRTPFRPTNEAGITFHKRSTFTDQSLISFVEQHNPDILYLPGRMDRGYLKVAKHFKGKTRVVCGIDKQWLGDWKAKLTALLSYPLYRQYFEYMWVPGLRQYELARRLGFPNSKILHHLYTGDTTIFRKAFADTREAKIARYPHNFVYVGRFSPEKGVDLLVNAFIDFKKQSNNDWKLIMVGNGDLGVDATHPDIEVKGFMPSEQLMKESVHWGALCVPSYREAWGVVIHEFSAAGLPLICADCAGATDVLLLEHYNGFKFKTADKEDLIRAMGKIVAKTDDELLRMGQKSHELSQHVSPEIAAYSIMSIVN
jgi:glycosyltransferase involved in cell wall biosynthesis